MTVKEIIEPWMLLEVMIEVSDANHTRFAATYIPDEVSPTAKDKSVSRYMSHKMKDFPGGSYLGNFNYIICIFNQLKERKFNSDNDKTIYRVAEVLFTKEKKLTAEALKDKFDAEKYRVDSNTAFERTIRWFHEICKRGEFTSNKEDKQKDPVKDKSDEQEILQLKRFIDEDIENRVSRKYWNGINPNLLSELCIADERLELNKKYNRIADIIDDITKALNEKKTAKDIRIVLSGDVCFGRSTQFFDYIQEHKYRINIYLPASEMKDGPIEYIYEKYLCKINGYKELTPYSAFSLLKSKAEDKIIIFVDDYDFAEKEIREKINTVFQEDNSILKNTDVIVKTRYRDSKWSANYIDVKATGVSDLSIQKVLEDIDVNISNIDSAIISSLKSPWLLNIVKENKNLIENCNNTGEFLSASYIEKGSRIRQSNDDVLAFAMNALLPQLEIANCFDKRSLRSELPEIIKEKMKTGLFPECGGFKKNFNELFENDETEEIFEKYFYKPAVEWTGLLSEHKAYGGNISYKWMDQKSASYFYAVGIYNLMRSGLTDQDSRTLAEKYINEMTESLVSARDELLGEKIEHAILESFDRARFLTEVIDKQLGHEYADNLAFLCCGIATIHEILGNEIDKFEISSGVLEYFDKPEVLEKVNKRDVAHWLNELSYYIIKCDSKVIGKEKYTRNVENAKDYLDKAESLLITEENRADRFEISKVYGNIGAYYQRKGENENAKKQHLKSLDIKKKCLKEADDDEEKNAIIEGIRRSYVSLATDCFYMKEYKESIEYHKKAIEISNSNMKYESYSRKVGSSIMLHNDKKDWSYKMLEGWLKDLYTGIELMGEYINKKELTSIYGYCVKVLKIMFNPQFEIRNTLQTGAKAKEIAISIEKIYNKVMWQNCHEVKDMIKEGE